MTSASGKPEDRSLTSEWWFWAAVVVAAAGVTGAVALAGHHDAAPEGGRLGIVVKALRP